MKLTPTFKNALALLLGVFLSVVLVLTVEFILAAKFGRDLSLHADAIFSRNEVDTDWFEATDMITPQSAELREGKERYTVSYDAFRRRVVPPPKQKASHYAIFLGGSFVFGDGINDTETLPYHFQNELPGYRSYNYGYSGGGANVILRRLETRSIAKEVSEPDGIVIYNFLDQHVPRAMGSLRSQAYLPTGPYYKYVNSKLYYLGSFREVRVFWNPILEFLANSSIFDRWLRYWDGDKSEHAIATTCAILDAIRENVKANLPRSRFVVAIYPEQKLNIAECLRTRGIEVWDFSSEHRAPITHWDGWHPVSSENQSYARSLARRATTK